jgi:hypothetical protein
MDILYIHLMRYHKFDLRGNLNIVSECNQNIVDGSIECSLHCSRRCWLGRCMLEELCCSICLLCIADIQNWLYHNNCYQDMAHTVID